MSIPKLTYTDSDDNDDDEFERLINFQPFSQESKKGGSTPPSSMEKKKKPPSSICTTPPANSMEETARRKVQSIPLPPQLTHPSRSSKDNNSSNNSSNNEIKWHKCTTRKKVQLTPCRICNPDESIGLDLPDHWDTAKKVLIQYMGHHCQKNERSLVSIKQICNFNSNTFGSKKWCPRLMEQYLKQLTATKKYADQTIKIEELYLERILSHVQNRIEQEQQEKDAATQQDETKQKDSNSNDTKTTQPPSPSCTPTKKTSPRMPIPKYESSSDEDDNDETSTLQKSKTEPIRAGDVIEYTGVMFVAGSSHGMMTATVLSVDSRRNPILILSNNDFLPDDHMVRRTGVKKRSKMTSQQGVLQPIRNYILQKSGADISIATGFLKETERIGNILQKNTTIFLEKVGESGFGDASGMMNHIKGKEGDYNIAVHADKQSTNTVRDAAASKESALDYVGNLEWKRKLQDRLSSLDKAHNHLPSNRKRSRRRSVAPGMTKEMLELALGARNVMETQSRRNNISFQDFVTNLAVDEFKISAYRLKTFLEGDEKNLISGKSHEETAQFLMEWTRGKSNETALANKILPSSFLEQAEDDGLHRVDKLRSSSNKRPR